MKNRTIGERIVFGFACLLIISAGFGLYAYRGLVAIDRDATRVADDCLPGVYQIGRLETLNLTNYSLTQRLVFVADPAKRAEMEKAMKANSAEMNTLYETYAKTIATPEDRQLYEQVLAARAPYSEERKKFLAELGGLTEGQAVARLFERLDPLYQNYYKAIAALVDLNRAMGEESGRNIHLTVAGARRGIVGGLLGALIAGVLVATLVIRTTNRRLRGVAETIAAGSQEITTTSGQVSVSGQGLASQASEQAASLEETSASLEELTSMTKRNAEHATAAKTLAGETRSTADAGAVDMREMAKAMTDLRTASASVAKIIKTIDEIAFQTNILALNAAVEAARAGEAGAGFAVVAEEVRNLAQRSASAAKETAETIGEAVRMSELGASLSGKVAAGFSGITDKTRQLDELVAEIANASREQSEGIRQISAAMGQIDKVTQGNAAGAEESAAAAEELNAQAITLQECVQELRALVNGRKTGSVAPASTTAGRAPHRPSLGGPKPAAAGDFFAEPAKRPVSHVSA